MSDFVKAWEIYYKTKHKPVLKEENYIKTVNECIEDLKLRISKAKTLYDLTLNEVRLYYRATEYCQGISFKTLKKEFKNLNNLELILDSFENNYWIDKFEKGPNNWIYYMKSTP
jgi:hypothetical protein